MLDQAFERLDAWVQTWGNGKYYDPNGPEPLTPLETFPIYGIQQNRQELYELCKVVVSQPWFHTGATAVEIGLGHFGSTHFLWRELFKKTISIELLHTRVNRFVENTQQYFSDWMLGDGRSEFIIGSSQSPDSVLKLYDSVSSIDFLFIDGNHDYNCALSDWLLYAPLVKSGGMVVLQDSVLEQSGVPRLITELKNGRFGKKYNVTDIVFSTNAGISFYFVD